MPMSVKVEYSKNLVRSGADLAQVEQQLASVIVDALGGTIRERVEERGDLGGQRFPGWDDLVEGVDGKKRGRRKFVSARYPDRARGEEVRGAEKFDSSADYHRANGTRPGTYHTTGGMWAGLSRVILTPTMVRALFRGRSEGQDPRFRGGQSRPIKVDNALKAATVLNQHGVNVLAPTTEEIARLGGGVMGAIAAGVEVTLPVKWDGPSPNHDLAAAMAAALSGR